MSDPREDPAALVATAVAHAAAAVPAPIVDAVAPDVLELRVHGVANTAPQNLLDLPREEIELAAGDGLGSFWQANALALAKRVRPRSAPIDDRGEIPEGVHREAYSWGGMVRGTPGDQGIGGAFVAGLARAGWAVLLPFSIANTAMWAWRLPTTGEPRWSARAGVIRLFGVLLTLLFVATASIVTLDVVAQQCFLDAAVRCTALPGPFEPMATWPLGVRLALLSLLPVLAVAGLWALSAKSRVRYDVAERFGGLGADSARPATASLFTHPRYWVRDGESGRLASMHFAAGAALVALILSTTWEGPASWVGILGFWISLALLLAALATAAGTRTMPFERRGDDRHADARGIRGLWHRLVALACATAWAAAAIVQAVVGGTAWSGRVTLGDLTFRISEAVVIALVTAMFLLLLVTACFRIQRLPGAEGEGSVQHERRYRGWRGQGPAVLLALGLGAGLIWSSLIAVGSVDWLNGSEGAGSNIAPEAALAAPTLFSWFGLAALALLVVVGAPVGIALAFRRDLSTRFAAWKRHEEARRASRFTRRVALRAFARPFAGPAKPDELDEIYIGGSPGDDHAPLRPGTPAELELLLAPAIRSKEATAARLHLVERYTALLGGGAAIAMLVAIVGASLFAIVRSDDPSRFVEALAEARPFVDPLLGIMLGAWTLIAIAVVGSLVIGGSSSTRPLAIVWDLSCFLPTSGHPLGPPNYLDRAAPEIARRLLWWLPDERSGPAGGRGAADPAERGRVAVLVAHSMGGVVATAALLLLSTHSRGPEVRERLSFLSYGVQLRAYFGRFFPELLGPDALGVEPCLAPSLFARDPWLRDFEDAADRAEGTASDSGAAADTDEGTSTRMPVHDWISLWRGSDQLGFPAFSNRPEGNRVDRCIEEFDATGYTAAVATHGEYIRSPRYTEALLELADALRKRRTG